MTSSSADDSVRGAGFGGLCTACAQVRFVHTQSGSTFLMCRLAKSDPRFAKYPPQPVRICEGYAS